MVGTQSFATGAPAEDGPEAAIQTATIQINTAAFAPDGTVTHTNGDKVVSAQVTTTDGAVATASSSVNLTFVNPDLLIGTLSAANSAVSAASQLWHGGDVTVGITPVPYSGKTVGSISVTLVQDPSAPTATVVSEDTAPFSFVFSADCEEPDELCLWQSDTADPDNLNITAAAYTDGSAFTLGGTPPGGRSTRICSQRSTGLPRWWRFSTTSLQSSTPPLRPRTMPSRFPRRWQTGPTFAVTTAG